jgi:hypothetical protein
VENGFDGLGSELMDAITHLEFGFPKDLRIFLGHQQPSEFKDIASHFLLKNFADPLGFLFLFRIQNNSRHDGTSLEKIPGDASTPCSIG